MAAGKEKQGRELPLPLEQEGRGWRLYLGG